MATYDERLWPPPALWGAGWLFVLSLTISFYVATGPVVAALVTLAGGALVTWGLVASAARVRVADGVLRAGAATIPVSLLGRVEVLDAARARALRGPESDPSAYHLIRGWIPSGIRVAVADTADTTPYWFVATRRPAQLAAAIESQRQQ